MQIPVQMFCSQKLTESSFAEIWSSHGGTNGSKLSPLALATAPRYNFVFVVVLFINFINFQKK